MAEQDDYFDEVNIVNTSSKVNKCERFKEDIGNLTSCFQSADRRRSYGTIPLDELSSRLVVFTIGAMVLIGIIASFRFFTANRLIKVNNIYTKRQIRGPWTISLT